MDTTMNAYSGWCMSRSCVRSHRRAFVVIMAMNMVITLRMIVTGSAKAVSVSCAEHLGNRGGAFAFLPMGR
jgi:hypothetical protein